MKFSLTLALTFSLFYSCSTSYHQKQLDRVTYRSISTDQLSELNKFLDIDRFLFYVREFQHRYDDTASEEVINALKQMNISTVLNNSSLFTGTKLKDAHKYNELIHNYLTSLNLEFDANELDWGYNFLKNKLNDAYVTESAVFSLLNTNPETTNFAINWEQVEVDTLDPSQQTLDAGQYISDRMTRGVFWEAAASSRTIEFHLSDSREFLKNLVEEGGSVIAEIKTKGSNYNKIYAVKYEGEDTYRYAITNIGGKERLEHLIYHLSLSNPNGVDLNNLIEIKGDLAEFHQRYQLKIENALRHLPKADRVLIGQKAAIESRFRLYWLLENLEYMFKKKKTKLKEILGAQKFTKLKKFLEEDMLAPNFNIEDHKNFLSDNFKKVSSFLDSNSLTLPRFLQYNIDNTVIEMSDIVFKNSQGKIIRWRVLSNTWGDEIIPPAKALKNTGHKNITYIGTAGVFPDRGYEVGDVVVPSHTLQNASTNKKALTGNIMPIELGDDDLKIGGTVVHVKSPFEETNTWMAQTSPKADFVEIETSYLRDIFNSQNDNLRIYLMISDVLGSEDESLASGSASKRKKGKLALLNALLKRDKAIQIDSAGIEYDSKVHQLRANIEEVFPGSKKGSLYKYYLLSHLEHLDPVATVEQIKSFASVKAFSDNLAAKRLIQAGTVVSNFYNDLQYNLNSNFKVGVADHFVSGKWHPGKEKIHVTIYASSAAELTELEEYLQNHHEQIHKVRKFLNLQVARGPPAEDELTLTPTRRLDDDYLLRIYTWGGMKQAGLDYQVTATGNYTFKFLPTTITTGITQHTGELTHLSFHKPSEATIETMNAVKESGSLNMFNFNLLKEKVEELDERIKNLGEREGFVATAKVKTMSTLPDGALARFEVKLHNTQGIIFELQITNEAKNNPLVILEEIIHMQQLVAPNGGYGSPSSFFAHPLTFAEMLVNAKSGSARAQHELAKAEVDALEEIHSFIHSEGGDLSPDVEDYITKRTKDTKELMKATRKTVRAQNKVRKGFVPSSWKTMLKAMDNDDVKLDDYIAANDREKVKELVSKYMAWDQMEPTEIALWQRWLNAIGTPNNPNSAKNNIFFRGLGEDLIKEADGGGHYLMSKMLTANQGSYNRRLRSLKTVLKKMRGGIGWNNESIHNKYDNVTSLFKGHSLNPVGSSLLSLASFNIANSFSSGGNEAGLAMISLHEDRYLYSVVSFYDGEVERLAPLVIFPDEILHLEEVNLPQGEWANINTDQFKAKAQEVLGRPLTQIELSESTNDINELEKTKKWWKTIQPKDVPSNPHSNICNDMMGLFLMN